MNRETLLQRLALGSVQNVAFADMVNLVRGFGFVSARVSGSHHIFAHDGVPELINIQNVGGQAKPCQVRQFLRSRKVQFEAQGASVEDYYVNIVYSAEDGGYVADIPDLQACSAFGGTPDEAIAQVECAKKAWLAAARKKHKPIPPPRYRPVIYQLPELKVAT
jgi:predicted RNase H-like HicB family nuclease/predicted RNA binding protein YcfA (HicA-like mRNA interferase family)